MSSDYFRTSTNQTEAANVVGNLLDESPTMNLVSPDPRDQYVKMSDCTTEEQVNFKVTPPLTT